MMSAPRETAPLLHRPYMTPYKKAPWFKNKMWLLNLIRRSLAEFFGTGLFVFAAVSALGNINPDPQYDVKSSSAILAALAQGLAYAGLVASMMHVSGGHLNPAVTVGVLVSGGVNVLAAVCYFVAQLTGGIVGASCVLAYDTAQSHSNYSAIDYGITTLENHLNPGQGILVEAILTMLLVIVFVHTTMERLEFRSMAPLVIGLTLAAGVLSSYSLTGGSMNPARSLGPAVVSTLSHRWKYHYVYWVGPLAGGTLAGSLYRLLLSSKPLVPLSEPDTVHRAGGYQPILT